MRRDFCDNCNAPANSVLNRVRVIVGDDTVEATDITRGNFVFDRWLCDPCTDAMKVLDFGELIRRHEDRPRKVELP